MSTTLAAPIPAQDLSAGGMGRWLAVVSHTDPKYGGLSAAVPQSELQVAARGNFATSLAAFCAPNEACRPSGYDESNLSFWPTSRMQWVRSSTLRRKFADQVTCVEGLHIHGLWEASTSIAGRTAQKLHKPYVVSAHGMLEPWALANKWLKKRIYAAFVERGIVAGASCLHALTHAEVGQYRAFGARGPIAVVPNAVEVPQGQSSELFFERYPDLRGRRLLLFLGRLHPKKGLPLLEAAWRHLAPQERDWHLVLAGPDAEGTEAKLRAGFTAAGLLERVTFTGMLGSAMKWSALAAAEGFVLPSYSEGLSMGVLEALGAGVPVVISRNCNLPEVVPAGAGWEVEAGVSDLTVALGEMLSSSPEELQVRGNGGSYLVTSRYNPRVVAEQMAEVYAFVSRGILPSTLELVTV